MNKMPTWIMDIKQLIRIIFSRLDIGHPLLDIGYSGKVFFPFFMVMILIAIPAWAQEAVVDVQAIGKMGEMLGKLDLQVEELFKQTSELEAQTLSTENIKETSQATSKFTDIIKDYIGNAKETVLESIDDLVGIENIEAAQEFGIKAVAVGKSLYGIYNTGKGIYETGCNIYESFANIDANIDDMVKQLEMLSQNRTELMGRVQELTSRISDAKSLSEIQKNQSAIEAAQLKMQVIQSQETEQTNMILLQQMAAENAENRKIQTGNEEAVETHFHENDMIAEATDISEIHPELSEPDPWEEE